MRQKQPHHAQYELHTETNLKARIFSLISNPFFHFSFLAIIYRYRSKYSREFVINSYRQAFNRLHNGKSMVMVLCSST